MLTSKNKICDDVHLSLDSTCQGVYIELLDAKECSTLHGAFDTSAAILEAMTTAYSKAYGSTSFQPWTIDMAYSLALRIYFLSNTSLTYGRNLCDFSNVIDFVNESDSEQNECLKYSDAVKIWTLQEQSVKSNFDVMVWLRYALGLFADPFVLSMFSKVCWSNCTNYYEVQASERKVIVDGTSKYAMFVNEFLACMDNYYAQRGKSMRIIRYTSDITIQEWRRRNNAVHDIVSYLTTPVF